MRIKLLPSVLLICMAVEGFSQVSTVTFTVDGLPRGMVEKVGIRGSATPLSWEKTLFLKNTEVSIDFPDNVDVIEYKYVLDDGTEVKWEGIENRQLSFPLEKTRIEDYWNKETPVDINTLEDIPSEQLLEDFELLREMVLTVHPGTYRYSDKNKIESVLNELRSKFQKRLSIGEAYLAMSKVTAAIQCDHTKVGFNNQNKYVNTVIHEQNDKLPFTFKWFEKRMFVDMNASDNNTLTKGVEILSINDIPVSKILSDLLPYVAADGATDKNRIQKLEVDGFDFRYNAFDVFFPLLYPLKTDKFNLKVKTDDDERLIQVNGTHRETRAKILNARYTDFPYTRDDMWKFKIEDGVGFLTLNSYGLMGWKAMTIDYKKFLAEAFSELKDKKIENLVIDIRKNTGGMDEMKKELFSYLETKHNVPTKREGRTRYTKFPENLKSHIKTWGNNPWYYNLSPHREDGIYFVFDERIENRIPIAKKPELFEGSVFMLIGPSNTSLAYYTARDFQHYEIGTLIGEETGGNLRDLNGGQILFLTLPNSGIEIDFPVMGGFSTEKLPNSGVIPDYIVNAAIQDFIEGRDAVMSKALDLIGN